MTEKPWRVLEPRGLLVAGTAALSGAWLVARATSGGVPHDVAITMLGLAAALIAAVAVVRWRIGVYLLLLWLVVEDLPRKFLGNDLLVYFGKDILAAAVYLGFVLEVKASRTRAFRPSFVTPLLIFVGVCAVQVLNPNSPSLLYGLLGLKVYLYYVPLMFLGFALVQTERDLVKFLILNLGLACLVAALGIVQGVANPDFLNPTTTPAQLNLLRLVRYAPLTGEPVSRPTSVFVSDGRFAWYMLLTLYLALGTVGYISLRPRRGKWVAFCSLALAVGAILISGSRGTLVYACASVLVFGAALMWGLGSSQRGAQKVTRVAAHAALAAGATAIAGAVFFPNALGARWAFYYQTIAPWSPTSELMYRAAQYPVGGFVGSFSFARWPLGYGIGTASLGMQYLTSLFNVPSTGAAVESGYGVLVLEMGVPGLVSWLAWTGALVWASWKVVRALQGSPLFPVAFTLFWFVFVLLFPLTYGGMQPYQNFVFNAFLWLLVGVLFRLPLLKLEPRPDAGSRIVRVQA